MERIATLARRLLPPSTVDAFLEEVAVGMEVGAEPFQTPGGVSRHEVKAAADRRRGDKWCVSLGVVSVIKAAVFTYCSVGWNHKSFFPEFKGVSSCFLGVFLLLRFKVPYC